MLHCYLEGQIELAFGFDAGERARWRAAGVAMTRTPDGGWWHIRYGHIPWWSGTSDLRHRPR